MSSPYVFILMRDMPDSAHLHNLYGQGEEQLEALAGTLAADPCWEEIQDATLIVRLHPSPVLGLMGSFDDKQLARIETLSFQLDQTLSRLRYVDYQQAEQDCERLAARLIQEIGSSKIKDCGFAAIPRGGMVVLGMLSYALDLSPHQLRPASDAPLVVVDDCAISGLRLAQFLTSCNNDEIIFASLYSHPELRRAVTKRQPRVTCCVSAWDLTDYAPDYHKEDYEAWRSRWFTRAGDGVYWVGMPEHICFAWSEPDSVFWNPVTGEQECGWKVIPQNLCLKNRMGRPWKMARILHQPPSRGELKPGRDVIFGDLGRNIVVADIQTGENMILDQVAADMWRAVINTTDLEEAAKSLLRFYQVDQETLRSDLGSFAEQMLEKGILVR